MNFKKEYKALKGVYPDIDKISKLAHFKIVWKRHISNGNEANSKLIDNISTNELSQIKK